jgi:hypothetical protein
MSYVLWVIPDRGGGWTSRGTASTLDEANAKRERLYDQLGDVSVRVLLRGEHPADGHFDVTDSRRVDLHTTDTTPSPTEGGDET